MPGELKEQQGGHRGRMEGRLVTDEVRGIWGQGR